MENTITLREISRQNLDQILALEVSPLQRGFVASNAKSLAQALIYSDVAWYRAIYNGDTPVGFLMTDETPGQPPFLWRLMIDKAHQRQGYGHLALSALCHRLKQQGTAFLETSCVPDSAGPTAFYQRYGFALTGKIEDDGEVTLRRLLTVSD